MSFQSMSEFDKKEVTKLMFQPLSSAQEIKDWVMFYLGLEIPIEITDPDSTSSPLDAIWQVYSTFKDNSGNKNPGYILMSCREGMKTVSVAILELLLLLHFELEICHAAAVEAQSNVGIKYIEGFMFKIEPLVKAAGWVNLTQNKRTLQFKTPSGKNPFIKIVICSPKGMNSLHANVIFLDELDLADPAALKEGANIVGYSRGIHGVKVYLSTRKYAFGNMAQAIEKAPAMNYKILNWNLIDVTERCPPERYLPEEKREDRYVRKFLPLEQKSKEEFDSIPEIEKSKWELIKEAPAGCKSCLLLPVCKTRLSTKPKTASGGFYKPIESVIQKFKENSPDIAEAQLMCWKPGSEGLVYPRFSSLIDEGNVISFKKAYESLTGEDGTKADELSLVRELNRLEVPMYAGVDWGWDHDFVICVVAMLPDGDVWLIECYASPGLEFVDQLEIAKTYRDKYKIIKWFADTNAPANIKSFNKNGMKCPSFTKDVLGGIESVRSKISSAAGRRMFKVLYKEDNKKAISAITKHRFKLDGQGNTTLNPDDERGIADICDTIRYIGQNLWPVSGTYKPKYVFTEREKDKSSNPTNETMMMEEIQRRLVGGEAVVGGAKKKGGLHWTF